MAAPKGNQFWKAHTKHGRDKLFESPEVLQEACEEYFAWVADNPLEEARLVTYEGESTLESVPKMRAMTLRSLCLFLRITTETWRQYRADVAFSAVCNAAEDVIYEQKFSGAAGGFLNHAIIARDLGLVEKTSVDHSSTDGTMSPALDTSKISTDALKQLLAARNAKDEK